MSEHKKKKKPFALRLLKFLMDVGVFVLIVLAISYVLSTFVAQRILVHNVSMQDTLMEGDVVLMDKFSYRFRDPERFQIICFDSDYEREGLIKRIIGMPGETIMISHGMIFINGNQFKDVKGLTPIEDAGLAAEEIHLGEDEYFVVGDNRDKSIDSRFAEVGNVKKDKIIGRAGLIIYPFNRFGMIR